MREIKFRAWDGRKGVNQWYASVNDPIVWNLEDKSPTSPFYTQCVVPDGVILMQYTGLKDKNGTPVYEGDIMLTDDMYHDYEDGIAINALPDGKFLEVKWENGAFYVGDEILSEMALYYKVIGDVYQNPELMLNHD